MSHSEPETSLAVDQAATPSVPSEPSSHPVSPASRATSVPVRRQVTVADIERLIAGAALVAAVLFNLWKLFPQVAIQAPPLNDMVFHALVLGRTLLALLTGQNVTDPWMAPVPALGYPLFHYYQHLPYLLLAALSAPAALVFRAAVSPAALVNWTAYLLLSLFPLSIYWSMRRFGFSRLQAGFGGLASCLIVSNAGFGLEFSSYVWRGYGLYTQLWGMFLLPIALAQCYVTLRDGRGYFWSVLLVAAVVMSHLFSGYLLLGSIVLLALLAAGEPLAWEKRERQPRQRHARRSAGRLLPVGRLLLLLLLVALVISYFVVPYVLDGTYQYLSVWTPHERMDSFGAGPVLTALAKGQLLDYGRLPSLTLLAAAGLAVCLWRWREARYRVPVALTLFWLLLYFGRPTWGILFDLLPMSRYLELQRLISGFHLGSIFLIGIGLAFLWSWGLSRRDRRDLLVPVILTALLLLPVYGERAAYLGQNAALMAESAAAYAAEERDLTALEATIAAAPPGRVYAGLPAEWGGTYKVGAVPMYSLLTRAGLDVLGYLYLPQSLNSDVQYLFQDGRQEQYNLFNIRYVLTPNDWTVPSFYKTLGDFGRHRLYEIPTTGYFDLVGSDLAFAGAKSEFYAAASAWLNSSLVKAKQHPAVYLGKVPAGGPTVVPLSSAPQVFAQTPAAAEVTRGRVISETVTSGGYTADVEVAGQGPAARDSLLMLKATYHPNWHATVDGVEAPTVMLMPSYVGVPVTPGTHHVRLEYRTQPWRNVLIVIGLLTLAFIAVGERRLARRRGELTSQQPGAAKPG